MKGYLFGFSFVAAALSVLTCLMWAVTPLKDPALDHATAAYPQSKSGLVMSELQETPPTLGWGKQWNITRSSLLSNGLYNPVRNSITTLRLY